MKLSERLFDLNHAELGRVLRLMIVITVLFLVVHPLLYIPGLRNPSSLPRYALLALVAATLVMLWCMAYWRGETPIRWNRLFTLLVVFFFWCIASLSWTLDVQTGLVEIVELLSLVFFSLVLGQIMSWRVLQTLLVASLIAASMVAAIGIGQNFGFNPLGVVQFAPPSSLFTNKNFVALYLDLVAPFGLLAIFMLRSNGRAWLAATAFGMILAVELVIRSRGSWLGLLCGLGVLLFAVSLNPQARTVVWQRLKSRYQPLVLSVVIALGVALTPSAIFGDLLAYKVVDFSDTSSASIRLSAYANSTQMIADNPVLGVGLGGFRLGFRPYMFAKKALPTLNEDIYLVKLHSDPLQVFVELGVIGGALFIALCLYALLVMLRVTRSAEPGSQAYYLSLGVLVALVVSLTHAWVDFPLHLPSSAIQFWALLGCAAGLYSMQQSTATISLKRSIIGILFGVGLLNAVFAVYFYGNWLRASAHLQQALLALDTKECARATALVDQSVQDFPFDYQARQYRVQIYSSCLALPPQQILQAMNEELAFDPYNTRALLTRGWLLANHNYLDAAETDYRRVTALLPTRASGFIGLGQVANLRGKRSEAIAYYQQASKVEPENALAARLLNELAAH